MIRRILALGGIGIAVTLAQSSTPAPDKLKQLFAYDVTVDPSYKPPKTPWGEPDLQGIWPLNHLINVNLERSPQYGDRIYKTDEELNPGPGRGRGGAPRGPGWRGSCQRNAPGVGHLGPEDAANIPDRRPAKRPLPRTHRVRQEASGGDEEQLQARADRVRQRR